jgi:hypothetical protein
MRSLLLGLVVVPLLAVPVHAQDPTFPIPPPPPNNVFVTLNGGFRSLSQQFVQQTEFTLYDERGIFEADHTIKSGVSWEAGAGLRLWRDLWLGASYAVGPTHTRDVTVNAQVPHPLIANRHRIATGAAVGLEHAERAIHAQALLRIPVTVEFDLTLFAGPTFFEVENDLVEAIAPTETGAPFSTVELGHITRSRQSHRMTGFNLGFDIAYMFRRHVGAGLMVRYSTGSADLELPAGNVGPPVEMGAGGIEIAAGLRLRF